MHTRRAVIALTLAFLIVACRVPTPPAPSTPAPTTPSKPSAHVTAQAESLPPARVPTTTAAPTAAPTSLSRPTAEATPTLRPSPTVAVIAAATATIPGQSTARPALTPASALTYVFPVRSQGTITYGRFHHDYPATDIFCSVGSAFVAVTNGVVDFVSRTDRWDPKINDGATRGGLAVAIIGDDSVRYYGSHLSQVADGIEPGVRVTGGKALGLTGPIVVMHAQLTRIYTSTSRIRRHRTTGRCGAIRSGHMTTCLPGCAVRTSRPSCHSCRRFSCTACIPLRYVVTFGP